MKLDVIQKTALLFATAAALVSTGGLGCSTEALLIAGDPAAAVGDYGDAPDRLPCQYPSGIECEFPTRFDRNGAHHLDITDSAFGPFKDDGTLSVSAEKDALDPADPDGIRNIAEPAGESDHDALDDGLLTPFLAPGVGNTIDFLVSVAPTAPKMTRYVNMLADFDQNGFWTDAGGTEEWIVQNMPVDVDPGMTATLTTPEFAAGAVTDKVWLRMTLSDTPIDPAAYPEGWEGKGEFAVGETEDYLLQDKVPLDLKGIIGGGGGPGGGGPGGGGPGGGGPGGGGPGGGGPGGGGPGGGGGGGGACDIYKSYTATICKGSSRTFLALVDGFAPDSVTATSSDPSVAGVDVNEANVTVTGESEGTATIEVTVVADGCTYHITLVVKIKKCGPKPKIPCCTPAEIAKDPSRCENCHVVGVKFYDNETPGGGGDSVNGGIEETGSWGDTDANNPTKTTVVGVGNTIKIIVTFYHCDPCPDEDGDGDSDCDHIPDEADWFPYEEYDPANPHDFEEQMYVDSFFDVFFDVNNSHEIFDQTFFTGVPEETNTPEVPEVTPPVNPYQDPYHPYDPYMYEKY
ncbi:MAG TPA: Ig-like domain-containing protein [bacterium]|nr:Ig-like domain-containing protein [bacterium]